MKRDLMAAGLAAVLTAVSVGLASAADEKPADIVPPSTTGSEHVSPQADPGSVIGNQEYGLGGSDTSQSGTSIQGKDLSAEDLWDQTVYDIENDEVGTVVAVTEPVGEDRKAIVEVGGFLGIGGKHVAVPVQRFQMQPDGRLVVGLTEEELEQMPEVRPEELSAIVR